MTMRELRFELRIGDVVNQSYVIEKMLTYVILAKNIKTNDLAKFIIDGSTLGKYKKIKQVSRNGETYYKSTGRGGYTHGVRKREEK